MSSAARGVILHLLKGSSGYGLVAGAWRKSLGEACLDCLWMLDSWYFEVAGAGLSMSRVSRIGDFAGGDTRERGSWADLVWSYSKISDWGTDCLRSSSSLLLFSWCWFWFLIFRYFCESLLMPDPSVHFADLRCFQLGLLFLSFVSFGTTLNSSKLLLSSSRSVSFRLSTYSLVCLPNFSLNSRSTSISDKMDLILNSKLYDFASVFLISFSCCLLSLISW